jgi:hypothetical protein
MDNVEHIHTTYHIAEELGYFNSSFIDKAETYKNDAERKETLEKGAKYKTHYYYNYIGGWKERADGTVFNYLIGDFEPLFKPDCFKFKVISYSIELIRKVYSLFLVHHERKSQHIGDECNGCFCFAWIFVHKCSYTVERIEDKVRIELAFEVIESNFIDFGLISQSCIVMVAEVKQNIKQEPDRIKKESDK